LRYATLYSILDKDVRYRFSYIGSVSVQFLEKTRIRFGMSLVRLGLKKTRFGLDIAVIYYLCNS